MFWWLVAKLTFLLSFELFYWIELYNSFVEIGAYYPNKCAYYTLYKEFHFCPASSHFLVCVTINPEQVLAKSCMLTQRILSKWMLLEGNWHVAAAELRAHKEN